MSMDKIIHSAIEEICSQGVNGLSVTHLWLRMSSSLSSAGLPLCPGVKRAVWSGLVAVPSLRFEARGFGSGFDPKSMSVDECERLEVRVFGNEQLRRCFVGLNDVKASNIAPPQQRVLELLALARGNGVTQNQLCKELGMPANNFFYVVKRLESWGLVVRKSTIVRTKETSGDKEQKSSATVHTNLIHLRRYALPLGQQQRLEIIKENKNLDYNSVDDEGGGDNIPNECGQDDVLVKDFLPALKAICDRLEQAEGKVLVVSDIKQELGYRESKGHRAWRNMCNRLKQAGIVEVFDAKVDKKVDATTSKTNRSRGGNKPVSCLRLLKKFSPNIFDKKILGSDNSKLAVEQTAMSGNRVQSTDQLVELSLEQQIFDMIDAEGSKGLLGIEVCRRLGISNKMLENLCSTMVPRYRLHQVSENCKRGSAYRFWTHNNFYSKLPSTSRNRSNDGPEECGSVVLPYEESSYCDNPKRSDLGTFSSKKWVTSENTACEDAEQQQTMDVCKEGRISSDLVVWSKDSQHLTNNDTSITVHASENAPKTSSLVGVSSCAVSSSLNLQQGQRYPSLTSAQREQRVLERLKTEKIMLRPELQRWLGNFEKDKQTRLDRKTLQRCLKKLEQEGECKLIDFSIPGVTNCGRHRDTVVVLHRSFEGSDRELSDRVQDRWRSFELEIRGNLSQSKNGVPVPVLEGIERIQKNSRLETPNAKAEAMRFNGFILARMVRTKMLHSFLWGYITGLVKCNGTSSWNTHIASENPHSSSILFELDGAIKAMPLELFFQVVGSPLKLEGMIEKCKAGVVLSDLPKEDYKSLMDTRATGRLSWLIDILRRLKLIRLVADGSLKDGAMTSHATLTYALELKPYIEEPPITNPLNGGSVSRDLRPHLRHDFILSTTKAVDRYWQTLEYCYAAADPKAAFLAFPGSVVQEVFLCRSWTTVRVMTAEQRDELRKRIKDHPSKKLNFQECREIAKDLKLTLDQVLRVYYTNRQKILQKNQGGIGVEDAEADRPQFRNKRKISSGERPTKQAKVNHESESHEDIQAKNTEKPEISDQQEPHDSPFDDCIMPMLKQPREPRFSWSEESDRQVIIQYARQRAKQGAKRGTDWATIGDLPAPPRTCQRRIALLNQDKHFRKSIMRLCNLLTQRYSRQLDNKKNLVDRTECGQASDSHEERWDDFEDFKIKMALNEVLSRKQMVKQDTGKRITFKTEGIHNISDTSNKAGPGDMQQKESSRRSRIHQFPQNFEKHLQEGVSFTTRVNQSLAASNAVELFKLVFLTKSRTTETPNLLAETLRCYSEHDLYTAFDYLREKKFMIGCGTTQPFVLSQHFLRNLSMSQFPSSTGKQAAKFGSWLYDKGRDLVEGIANLPSDLQCGDIFHLFALVSSGELSISPKLPHDGVGEAEDIRSSKRKPDDNEFDEYGLNKKIKLYSLQEYEIFSRREKGFPGVAVSVSRVSITRPSMTEFFKDESGNHLLSEDDSFYACLGQKVSCMAPIINHFEESLELSSIVPGTTIYGDSLWEVMKNYIVQHLLKHSEVDQYRVHPELIKTAYMTIQKAGDQGLSMSKISESTKMEGTVFAEQVVDVLQLFGLVVKVNSYDSIHVVDSLFRTKYFLTSKATSSQDSEKAPSSTPQTVNKEANVDGVENRENETTRLNKDEEHKVTIMNMSEDISHHSDANIPHDEITINEKTSENRNFEVSATAFQPILPWINGDGTINEIVYRGLTRRIIGIVALNPGILEDNILSHMEVLNPQSCRRLLELMVLDKHLIVRKMTQSTSSEPPSLLQNLIGTHLKKKPKFSSRRHYFANPISATLL